MTVLSRSDVAQRLEAARVALREGLVDDARRALMDVEARLLSVEEQDALVLVRRAMAATDDGRYVDAQGDCVAAVEMLGLRE